MSDESSENSSRRALDRRTSIRNYTKAYPYGITLRLKPFSSCPGVEKSNRAQRNNTELHETLTIQTPITQQSYSFVTLRSKVWLINIPRLHCAKMSAATRPPFISKTHLLVICR